MKKIIIIILLIIAALILYITYYSDNTPLEKTLSNTNDSSQPASEQLEDKPIPEEVLELYDFTTLEVDTKLLLVKINQPDTIYINKKIIDLSIIVPHVNQFCDVFLLINKIKKDMFYQVGEGSYEFKKVPIIIGLNEVEVFYRIGKKRANSSICVIVRE